MGQLKLLTPQGPTQQPRATADDFGAQEAQALSQLGQQISATTNTIVDRVVKPMARNEAANYGKELSLRVEQITANKSNFTNWQAEFDAATTELQSKYGKTAMGGTQTFKNDAALRTQDGRLSLTSQLNARAAEAGKEAYDAEVDSKMGEIYNNVANAPDQRARDELFLSGLRDFERIVADAVVDGNLYPEEAPAELARLRAQVVTDSANLLIANGEPLVAIAMLDFDPFPDDGQDKPIANPHLTAEIRAKAWKAYNAKIAADGTSESTRRARRTETVSEVRADAEFRIVEAIRTGKDPDEQFANVQALFDWSRGQRVPADENGSGERLLTADQVASIDRMLQQGSTVAVTATPQVQNEITALINTSTSRAEFQEKLLKLADADKLGAGEYSEYVKLYDNTRLRPYYEELSDAIEAVTKQYPKLAGSGVKAQEKLRRYIAENPNATDEEIRSERDQIIKTHDVFNIREDIGALDGVGVNLKPNELGYTYAYVDGSQQIDFAATKRNVEKACSDNNHSPIQCDAEIAKLNKYERAVSPINAVVRK